MAQSVKWLLHQHKDLSWNQHVVACTCHLSSGAMKTRASRELNSQFSSTNELLERNCSKTNKESNRDSEHLALAYTHTQTCTLDYDSTHHRHMYTHTKHTKLICALHVWKGAIA